MSRPIFPAPRFIIFIIFVLFSGRAVFASSQTCAQVIHKDNLLEGYFMSKKTVQVGNFVLDGVAFGEWGVWLEWKDITSQKITTELGEAFEKTIRVRPTGCHINGSHISFTGRDSALGDITFSGNLKRSVSRKNTSLDNRMVGVLKVGNKTFNNLHFDWWTGD